MAVTRPIQCVQVQFVSGNDTIANLQGVTGLVVRTSADVFLDFDQPTASTQSFKLLAANTADTTIEGFGGTIQNLYVRGASTSGTLYVIAVVK